MSNRATTVILSLFSPFGTLAFDAPSNTPLNELLEVIDTRYPHLPAHLLSSTSTTLSCNQGPIELDERPLSALCNNSAGLRVSSGSGLVTLRLAPALLGGKGGFGSQLRAAGGRMSSQKTTNNDSCRDLNGRRISTIKEANKFVDLIEPRLSSLSLTYHMFRMAEYIENEPARKKAVAEAKKAKLQALERQLGIDPSSTSGAGPSSVSTEIPQVAGKKHRFDDTAYLEQSRDIVDGVKNAVAAGKDLPLDLVLRLY